MARILLLEDDPDLAEAVELSLRLDGHEVARTANGRAALIKAAREPWDLVILDIDVEELSGLAVGRAIADFSAIPTLVFSASGGDWEREAFRAGATACLRKPADLERLCSLVDTLAGASPAPPELDVTRLPPEDIDRLRRLSPDQLDRLPFGVIQLDQDGVVVKYNAYEAANAELSREDVIGRRFADVAPCTQVKRFISATAEAYRTGGLDRVLRFVFPCHGASAVVAVRLYFDAGRLWLFIARRPARGADRVVSADRALT